MTKRLDEASRAKALLVQDVQRLLLVRLGALRRIIHRSAKLAYGRETGLREFDWRVVSFVGHHARPVLTVVSDSLRRDKAQVSRTVAKLIEAGLLGRAGSRAPLRLTEDGRAIYRRINRLQRERNAYLLSGLSAQDRRVLDAILDKLFMSALQLLDEERSLQGPGAVRTQSEDGRIRPSRLGDRWRTGRTGNETDPASPDWLVVPDLHVLMQLLHESAALAYRRTAGLTHFDWYTITNIAVAGPMTLVDLAEALDRDKTQASRTIARLVEQGIVKRQRDRESSRLVLSLSKAGSEVFDVIHAEARRRDRALIGELTVRECDRLFRILDRITQNGLALMVRERSLETTDCDRL